MTTLSEFLLARITEDEAAARELIDNGPEWMEEAVSFGANPDRVLAECEARRRIVEGLHNILGDAPDQADGTALRGYVEALWVVVQELAAVYADHPDYQPGWKPLT